MTTFVHEDEERKRRDAGGKSGPSASVPHGSTRFAQTDLANVFGSQSNVSEVLNGKREINARQARELAKRFGVRLAAFEETLSGRPMSVALGLDAQLSALITTGVHRLAAQSVVRARLPGLASLMPLLLPLPAFAQAPIIQPGLPGAPARELSADEASEIAGSTHTEADVRFMRDMIPHHQQAIEMAALVEDRTNRSEIRDVAGRIDASQKDEIEFMQEWLADRSEDPPDPHDHSAMRTSHMMAGIATLSTTMR